MVHIILATRCLGSAAQTTILTVSILRPPSRIIDCLLSSFQNTSCHTIILCIFLWMSWYILKDTS